MTDPSPVASNGGLVTDVKADASAALSQAKADVAKVETTVKADVASVETKVTSFWNLTAHPWLTHAGAALAGYVAAHTGIAATAVSALLKVL
jgi:hypothetical protein